MPVLRLGPACRCGCGRPARELGGYSTPCWMALPARERALLTWEQATEPIDALELWWRLPAREPRRAA
jgi:hypothetical protein